MKNFLLLSVFILPIICLDCYAQKNKQAFKIVGYYSIANAITVDTGSVPFDKLTHINLYFLNPDSAGNFMPGLTQIFPFVKAAHAHHTKVLLSVGGGVSHPLYHRFLKDSSRPAFINNLLQIILNNSLDGIDVDLEGDDIDKNYEAFITGLKKACRQHNKLLTAAVAIFYKDSYSNAALNQFDFMNVMSYDHTGPWDLSLPGPHSTYQESVDDINYFRNTCKISSSRLTLGVGFYGYSFGPLPASASISMNYSDIVNTFPAASDSDQVTLPNRSVMYYNGAPTIKKKIKLAEQKASGIMIWQISGDATGDKSLLTIIHDSVKQKSIFLK